MPHMVGLALLGLLALLVAFRVGYSVGEWQGVREGVRLGAAYALYYGKGKRIDEEEAG